MKKENLRLFLNMQMVADYMDDRVSDYIFYRGNDPMILEDVRLYFGQQEVSERCVYLTRPEYLKTALEKNCALILVGGEPLADLPVFFSRSVIQIPAEQSLWRIMELIQNIFSLFRTWSSDLNQILLQGGDLAALCDASAPVFHNPIYILDHDNNAVIRTTYVVGMMTMKPDPNTGNLLLPAERRNMLYHSEEFLQTYKTHTAQYWTPSWNKHRDIYINVFDEHQRYLGRILINELQSSLKASQLRLLEYFCQFVEKGFLHYKANRRTSELPLQKLLDSLLFDPSCDVEMVQEQLGRIGWKHGDGYLAACAALPSVDDARAYTICLDIIEHAGDGVAFFRGARLYTVFHLPQSETNAEPYYAQLHELGLKDGIRFGASSIFFNILRLKEYVHQASIGLEYGMKKDPDQYCQPFPHIALSYLLRNSVGELDLHTACSASLRILRKNDREKGSDYYNTLREYIRSNCQPVQAAKSLFLHRGTLTYRLNKICELTGLDLNDRDTVLYLDLSFRIVDLYQEENVQF